MTTAWSSARPGEPASDWLRVVHPIDPPMADLEPDRQLLVLVAGLRRAVAEAAEGNDERAKSRLALARETFGEPARDQITTLLARAAIHEERRGRRRGTTAAGRRRRGRATRPGRGSGPRRGGPSRAG